MNLSSDEVIAWLHGFITARMRRVNDHPRPSAEKWNQICEMVLSAERSEKNYVVGLNLNNPPSST
jgi:hypothetical protein